MTIQNEVYREDYNGNDSTLSFPVSFYFFDDTHLEVILVAADNTETVQVLNTDYTVIGAGNPMGGSVEMVVPPATGERLVIIRDVPVTQLLDYVENDNFPAESHEGGLDKLTMIVQQQQEQLDRSLQLNPGVTAVITLPVPDAGKALQWNQAEDNLQNTQFNPDDAETAANAAIASAAAAASSETNAAASEVKAEKWADEDEDVEVEPGAYSAKHWAAKAQGATPGTFVSNPNGNPTIVDDLFNVEGNIGGAWESVGPTGSGADNIWTALDSIPADTDWVELKFSSTCFDATPSDSLLDFVVHARQTGSIEIASAYNRVLRMRTYGQTGIATATAEEKMVKIPIDSLRRFDLIAPTKDFDSISCAIYLMGYGTNP